jgi:hypothetical protein
MNNKKVIAFYLPQFHEIPENNSWWGKGFTEWTNVKKSKKLYVNHNQPRIPLNNNYYNLTDLKTIEWQAKIASENNIHGFCFYHYWFNGKLLLEKPIELFKESTINFNYCLSWANEPWTRTWEGSQKNILMPQKYGGEKEWRKHFEYLLPFFLDKRYIKINNKPIFLFYRASNIPNCDEMILFWNQLALENNLKGIYFIESLTIFQNESCIENSEALVEFEPLNTLGFHLPISYRIKKKTQKLFAKYFNENYIKGNIHDYNFIWELILKKKRKKTDKKRFLGAFVDWDNSPRKGNKALIIDGATPEKFDFYLRKQINNFSEEYIFINAWNEWAEGTYLEPDTKNGNGYLERIKKLINKY